MDLKDFPITECQCETCQGFCHRPCWPTPAEAEALLAAGLADRLMLDWWEDDPPIYILCGALPGSEGQMAPTMPLSEHYCTFYRDGLCTLHDRGLKPLEGRISFHGYDHERAKHIHRQMAHLWNSDEGRAAVERWRQIVGVHHDREITMGDALGFIFDALNFGL